MAATYITVAEFRTLAGIGSLYSSATIEEVCQTAEDLLDSLLWFDSAPVIGAQLSNNVITLAVTMPTIFVTNQSVTVSGCGATYNGTFTITGVLPSTAVGSFVSTGNRYNASWLNNMAYIQYAKVATNDDWHQIRPFGKAIAADTKTATYAVTGGVREAAAILAMSIWQARQVPTTGGMDASIAPSPFRMGNALMGTVRGLIAPYMNPAAMVG